MKEDVRGGMEEEMKGRRRDNRGEERRGAIEREKKRGRKRQKDRRGEERKEDVRGWIGGEGKGQKA